MKKPRISYREWLHRKPTPTVPADAVAAEREPAAHAPAAPAPAVEPPRAATAPAAESSPAVPGDTAPALAESAPPAAVGEAPEPAELPAPAPPSGTTTRAPIVEEAGPGVEVVEHLVFRMGRELFAVPLGLVEEAIDIDRIQRIPEMSPTMLGVLTLRGSTVPVYAPSIALGTSGHENRAALIFVRARGTVALAVDDVDDVLVIAAGDVQRAPLDFGDGVLLGVVRRGTDLIGVLDADALIAACRAEPVLETA